MISSSRPWTRASGLFFAWCCKNSRISMKFVTYRLNDCSLSDQIGEVMSKAVENLVAAQRRAMEGRPEVGGFPYLAATLRKAGVTSNVWHLPSCQSIYITEHGAVVQQLEPLVMGAVDIPPFDEKALITALRADQSGKT